MSVRWQKVREQRGHITVLNGNKAMFKLPVKDLKFQSDLSLISIILYSNH